MSKKWYRFFGGLLTTQEKWLNKKAEQGYRLIRAGKLLYEFEECKPRQVSYCVEFIGEKSKTNAKDYRAFLEEMGYRVFYKNINLSYSIVKARWRPWAEKGGRIATNASTLHRELLIVEKENDGKPFALHTSHEDKADYYRKLRAPWLFLFLLFGVLGTSNRSPVAVAFTLTSLLPVAVYQSQIVKLKHKAKTSEW